MKSERLLEVLFKIIQQEVKSNQMFRARLEIALSQFLTAVSKDDEQGRVTAPKVRAVSRAVDNMSARRRNRRAAAILNPISEVVEGPDKLRSKLEGLDIEQLRDVVAEYGMDPKKLVIKWRDHSRIIQHIIDTAEARLRKGDAFRALT